MYQAPQIIIVWLLLKLKILTIIHILMKLPGAPEAELLHRSTDLLLFNLPIGFILVAWPNILPRQLSREEIDQDIPNSFEVISSGKFFTQVSMYWSISGSTSQRLIITVSQVFLCGFIIIFLSQTHIDYVDNPALLMEAHQEIIWFDISMNEIFLMHQFKSVDELISQHQCSFKRKLIATKLEQISEARPQ